MRNIKLTLEYDGSGFFGFQRQNGKPTIQSELEKALSRLLNCPMKISAAAGRTDSGVHALAQVINFKTDSVMPLGNIRKGLNALLPKEIAVKSAADVSADFHARYSARWKTYEYLVFNSKVRSPLLNGRVFQFPHPLDLKEMKKAAKMLVGRHNFKSFQSAGSSAKDPVRFIKRFSIFKRGKLIRLLIEADGFLYHMVRNLAGTLLQVGRGSLSLKEFSRLLCVPTRPIATVPARGLALLNVSYKKA